MLFSEFWRVKYKKFIKIEQNSVFVYIPGFIFYGVSHAKADLHNKYINFVFGSFFSKIIY